LIEYKCGSVADGATYDDPATEQCCGSGKYTVATQFCQAGTNEMKSLCGGATFTAAEFCSGGTVIGKCGGTASGAEYNPSTENCCGSNKYTTATQFCQAGTNAVKDLCGGATYISSQGCCGTATFTQATQFCDARDNKTYKHKLIGSQTWMAENLNYNASGSKCYDNSETNCNTYGRLYNWATAMANSASSSDNPSGVKGVCPTGWHLPSDAEWTTLTDFVGGSSTAGTKLKAASGWNTGSGYIAGTDNYGFTALPGGDGYSNGSFYSVGYSGYWSSATESDTPSAWDRYMDYNDANVSRSYGTKTRLFSVRCVQD
jgi:uncharacterized protein (TIGR02145 family)